MTSSEPRILLTSARMPFAVDEVRKLGLDMGHYLVATDTFKESPGLHSKGVSKRVITAPPTQEPDAFVDDVIKIIDDEEISIVLPAFEEVFYLAANRAKIQEGRDVTLFFPELDALLEVNDKTVFAALCKRLDLPVAETIVCTTAEEFVTLREPMVG